jgi:nitroimidazol reductase NimA-like FMN-containing flavoprotein (pyridoxamine 5'-phosphate oxidase superfamily)
VSIYDRTGCLRLAVSGDASMRTLDRVECLEFLPTKKVGRLGYVTDAGPRIVPLNYTTTPDSIVVRTLAYGEVARSAVDQQVAFQIDDIDEFLQTGWSVLIVGTAKLVGVEELKQIMSVGGPEPWAGGPRTLFLRIPLTTVTGRQVLAP